MRGRRRTEQDYIDAVRERPIYYIEGYTGRNYDQVLWGCNACGNEWSDRYNKVVNNNKGCPVCSHRSRRKTALDYHNLVKNRDIEWVGSLPNVTSSFTNWLCLVCDNEWENSYSYIKQGKGCPFCAGTRQKTEQDYIIFTQGKSFYYLEGWTGSARDKVLWKCRECEFVWEARYGDISVGGGCPKCARLAQCGENSRFWKGGTSNDPYPPEWNENLKVAIKYRDNFTCQICQIHQDNLNYGLRVHHINYNKQNCSEHNLISLCTKCHSKLHAARQEEDYWQPILEELQDSLYK